MKIIALIPARSGSTRIPDKNIKLLGGHPLMAYTIASAKQSGIFEQIWVSSDSSEYLRVAELYGSRTVKRPFPISDHLSSDIEWVTHALNHVKKYYELPECFAILRPTNPFRKPSTIIRAWDTFQRKEGDSLRAVSKCKNHPFKMWIIREEYLIPFTKTFEEGYFDQPYQALAEVFIQNSALQIGWCENVLIHEDLTGRRVIPFFMNDYEAFNLDEPIDWITAEEIYFRGLAELPKI